MADVDTNDLIKIELTPAEAEMKAKAEAKDALLAKLGITEEEARLLVSEFSAQ
jgi:hypothetical protein